MNDALTASDDIARQINPAFERFHTRISQFVARLPLFFLAAAAFGAIVAAGVMLARLRFWDRLAPNAFIAGIYRQAFRVASGIVGIVVALDLLGAAALLGTILGATVFKGWIVNYSQNPARRFVFDIGIDPDADPGATRLLAQAALRAQPLVLDDREELGQIEDITEAVAILRVTGWIDQDETGFVTSRCDAIRPVKDAIETAGVAIPDTTYRILLERDGTSPARRRGRHQARSPPPRPRQRRRRSPLPPANRRRRC